MFSKLDLVSGVRQVNELAVSAECPKPRSRSVRWLAAVLLMAGSALCSSTAQAAALTWDITSGDNPTITPGSGNWNTTAGNLVWNNNTNPNVIWSQTNTTTPTNSAIFAGTDGTYTVTLGAQMAASSVTFNNSGYTLTGQTLYLGGASVAANKSATINSVFTNANTQTTITVNSGATLNLGGNVTGMQPYFTGGGTVNLSGGASTPSVFWFNTIVNQTGGTITPSTYGFVGYGPTGVYTLSNAAKLNMNSGNLVIARLGGTGTVTLQNTSQVNFATTSTNTINIDNDGNAANHGTLDVQGGTLTAGGSAYTSSVIQLSPGGSVAGQTATLKQEGGTINAWGGIAFGGASGTYSGGTASLSMTGGALYVGSGTASTGISAGAVSPTDLITLSGGTIGALAAWSSAMNMSLGTSGGNVTFQAANASGTAYNIGLSGVLSDVSGVHGGLTKTGGGMLTLSGVNTYSGSTAIASGILNANSTSALGDGSATNTLNFTGGTLQAGGTINSPDTRSVKIGVGGFNGIGVIDTNGNAVTIADKLNGQGQLTKIGQGTLTLTATSNNFSPAVGESYVNAGTLLATTSASLPGFSFGAWQANAGATLAVRAADTPTNNEWTGANLTTLLGTLPFNGSSFLGIDVASGSTFTYGSDIGSGETNVGLVKSNSGLLILNGVNTYIGGTTISAGTLQLGTGGSLLGSGAISIGSGAVFSYANPAASLTLTGSISGVGALSQNGGGDLFLTPTSSHTNPFTNLTVSSGRVFLGKAAAIVNPTTTIGNLGILVFAAPSAVTNPGAITVQDGGGIATRQTAGQTLNNVTLPGSGTVVFNNDEQTTYGLTISSSQALTSGGTLTVQIGGSRTTAYAIGAVTLSGTISGNGSLAETGSGRLVLSGSNSYTGGTFINAGTLYFDTAALDDAHSLPDGTPYSGGNITVQSGGTLAGNWTNFTGGTLTLNGGTWFEDNGFGGSWTGPVVLSATSFIASDYSQAITGNVSGSGGLTKEGDGILTLNSANTYTGKTTVNAGTLQFTSMLSLYNNTPASWTAANIYVKSAATLALNVDSAGTAGFNSGNLNTLLTNISVASSGTAGLQAGAILGFDTSTATGATFTQGYAIADSTGANGGAIGVTKLGDGTLVFDKTNTYTGGTTISAGMLAVTNAASLGATSGSLTIGAATLQVTTNSFTSGRNIGLTDDFSTIDVDTALTYTNTGTLSGIGGLTKIGDGTLALSGSNTYKGATTLSAGVLSVAATANLGAPAANLVFNGGVLQITGTTLKSISGIGHAVTFTTDQDVGLDIANAANTFTVDKVLNQGLGGFYKYGAGTVILNQDNTTNGFDGGSASNLGWSQVYAGTLLATKFASLPGVANDLWYTLPSATLAIRALEASPNGEWTTANLDLLLANGNNPTTVTAFAAGSFLGIEVTGSNSFTYSHDIAGKGGSYLGSDSAAKGLVKLGSGTLILSGSNTYTGGTFVNEGILAATDSHALPDNQSLTVGAGGTLIFDPSFSGSSIIATPVSAASSAVSPVPEPGTIVLLLAAFGSAAACRRFSKRRKG